MKIPECKFTNYIFVVTGMSYIIDSSGTSKVVKAHEDIFCANGIGYITIFPISRSRGEGANWHCTTTGCYGFTIDGQFIGVMTAKEVLNSISELDRAGKNCIGVLVHHIIRTDIAEVEWILEKIKDVPVVYYLHDFYTCCINPNLMKNDNQSCIDRDIPCEGCYYFGKKAEHLEKVRHFLRAFENRITFVAPAEYTKKHWIAFYPEYADKTIVISHQKAIGEYSGNKETALNEEPLRLGFVGAQKQIKGWDIFKKVVAAAEDAGCNYDFYYFGNGSEKVDGVTAVNVDIATQGKDAMIKNLKEKRISAVFLVCVCGETYSYTTYESHAANCYIFAMKSGGNIPYTVEKNHWGHVFSTEEELVKGILDEKTLREEINTWKKNAAPGAAAYMDNDGILKQFSDKRKAVVDWKSEQISLEQRLKRTALNVIFKELRLKNKQ